MPFWNRKNRDPHLSQSVVKQQQATRSARAGLSSVSDRVATVIALLQDQPDWDFSINQSTSRQTALDAAAFIGFHTPFDDEETSLLDYLSEHFAGRKIATFAWGLYADQLRDAAE